MPPTATGSSWSIHSRSAATTLRGAGTGSCPSTKHAARASRLRSRRSSASSWERHRRGRSTLHRVFVAGLSAGGAMAAILAATYPDLFAAVAVHSGLAYRSAATVGAAFSAMARGSKDAIGQGRAAHAAMGNHARAVPSIVVHGSADSQGRAGQRRPRAPAVNDRQPARRAREQRPRHRAPGNHFAWPGRRRPRLHAPAVDGPPRRADARALKIDGLGHAWSGGAPGGSYTDPQGPDATEAILRFFAQATAGNPRA